eukprot:9464935-Pyramimonas_sp.AAC.2
MERLRSLQQVQNVLKVLKQQENPSHVKTEQLTPGAERQLAETLICLASNFDVDFVERIRQLQAWISHTSVLEDVLNVVNKNGKAGWT